MKKWLLITTIFLFPLHASAGPQINIGNTTQKHCKENKATLFKNEFRKLWMEQLFWTSNYITSSTTTGAEEQKEILERLIKNQEDIGNITKQLYGDKAGDTLITLLKKHVHSMVMLVDATKAKNQNNIKNATEDWHKNAENIAVFLSKDNTHFKKEMILTLFNIQFKLITTHLSQSLSKNWSDKIHTTDAAITHSIKMADTLSDGIIKNFPEKFH